MAKFYKEMKPCRMCKKRFQVDKNNEEYKYYAQNYCLVCCKKYFTKEKLEAARLEREAEEKK